MMVWQICLNFGMVGAPPQGNIHSKNGLFPFWHYQAMDVSLFLCSCVYALAVLGRMPHYHVF